MLVDAREWRNNASQVALPTLLPVTKVRSKAREVGRSLAFKTIWRMCFSIFRTSRSQSFVFKQTFSLFLLLTDKTRRADNHVHTKGMQVQQEEQKLKKIHFHQIGKSSQQSSSWHNLSSTKFCLLHSTVTLKEGRGYSKGFQTLSSKSNIKETYQFKNIQAQANISVFISQYNQSAVISLEQELCHT